MPRRSDTLTGSPGTQGGNTETPKYVYLDLAAWRKLAGAAMGERGSGKYASLLSVLQARTKSGRIVCPISDAHLMEAMSLRDPLHRKALACVMVPLSAGWFLRPASELARDELRTAVARTFGKPEPLGRCPGVGRTLLSALGNPKLLMQEMGLTGPMADWLLSLLDSPAVLEDFLLNSRPPHLATRSWSRIASQCERNRSRARAKARGKKAWCALSTMAIHAELEAALGEFRLTMRDWSALGPDELTRFFSRVPVFDVEMELDETRNDHSDRAADDDVSVSLLSVAVPHCDIVIIDEFWADVVRTTRLDNKYSTVVLHEASRVHAYI